MSIPPLLVTVFRPPYEKIILLVDVLQGTYQTLLPYYGPICARDDALFVARLEDEKTRLEKYDCDGLVWLRRLRDCVDTHCVCLAGDEIAVSSTGTNEVLFLDAEGVERRRWSPAEDAEADSWHINSLAYHDGRMLATCFGRFDTFRGWSGRIDGSGLLFDLDSGRTVLSGFSAPHDPSRGDGGWFVNDSARSRTLWCPDRGAPQAIVEWAGFSRGLAVLPDALVIGYSSPRGMENPSKCATLIVFDRQRGQVVKSIPVPFPEIGHVIPAPAPDVLDALRRAIHAEPHGMLPDGHSVAPEDRTGSIAARGGWRSSPDRPGYFEIALCVTNGGRVGWSSSNRQPIHVAHQILDAHGDVLLAETVRARLPMPVLPGRSLTFAVAVDLGVCRHMPRTSAIRFTLVQEGVAWWEAGALWTPAHVALPEGLH